MPTLSEMYVYPIKSCAAVAVNEIRLVKRGMALDRHWMLVDAAGKFVSQRQYPALAVVSPTLTDVGLSITAPGFSPLAIDDSQASGSADANPVDPASGSGTSRIVSVWRDSFAARDAGDLAAQWFSDYVGTSLRLMRFDDAVTRLADRRWTGGDEAPTQFSDGFPFLVTNEASLDDLNERLQAKGAPAITMDRFRPNLVISGIDAYEEDHIASLAIGGAGGGDNRADGKEYEAHRGGSDAGGGTITLRFVKPCARCPIPSIDQSTGQRDARWPHEPLDTLAQYRADPRVDGGLTFGQNAILVDGAGALLRRGAHVEVELDFPD